MVYKNKSKIVHRNCGTEPNLHRITPSPVRALEGFIRALLDVHQQIDEDYFRWTGSGSLSLGYNQKPRGL